MLARFLIGHMFGIALAASASGWLGERYGWQAVFFALAGLYVAIAALLWFELRTNPATRRPGRCASRWRRPSARMAGLTRRPWVRVVLVTVFLEGALFYGALAFAALPRLHRISAWASARAARCWWRSPSGGLIFAASPARLLPRIGQRGLVLAGGCS